MKFPILFVLFLGRGSVTSLPLDSFRDIIEDYTKVVKGFHSVAVVSCPTQFNSQEWIRGYSATTPDLLFQYLDMSQGIMDLSEWDTETNCRQVVVVDLGCPEFKSVLENLSDRGMFSSYCRDFLFLNTRLDDESWFEREFLRILSVTEFTFISNVNFLTKFPIAREIEGSTESQDIEPETENMFVYDVWNPGLKQGGTLKMDLIGIYRTNSSQGLSFQSLGITSQIQRRLDLSELHLECAIVVTSPFNDTLESYITHNYDSNLDTVHRFNFRTFGLLQEYLHFKLHVKRVISWGYLQNASDPYSFDGMIGMIYRKHVDFGCSPAWFRWERTLVVDYGAQTWAIRPIFLFRHPNTKGLGKNVFLEPFESSVWVALMLSSVVIILLMAYSIQQDKHVLGVTNAQTVLQSMSDKWWIMPVHVLESVIHVVKSLVQSTRIYVSVILQQGVPSTDEGHLMSSKIGVFLLFVYSFLLFQFYSASIVGSLLMAPPKTIKTIPDLTNSRLQIGIQDIVYNKEFFKTTTDPYALELYEKKVKVLDKRTGNFSLNYYTIDEGLKKLQYEPFAFHVDLDYVYHRIIHTFNEKDICDLTMIFLYARRPMGNAFPKGSPFRYALNYGVHRVRETGLYEREKKRWIADTPECNHNIQAEDLQVELFPLKSLYWVLFGGMVLSIFVLILELIMDRVIG